MLDCGGTERWRMTAGGHFIPSTDMDIGAAGNRTRPRNIYINYMPEKDWMYCKRLAELEELVTKLNKRLRKLEKK